MGQVVSNLSMSLDGFIEDANGSVETLFEWYSAGPVEVKSANPDIPLRLAADDAAFFRQTIESIGALIAGRRLFDVAHGWNGVHPVGVPVFVVTHRAPTPQEFPHPKAPFTFVTDGVESAIAQAKAPSLPRVALKPAAPAALRVRLARGTVALGHRRSLTCRVPAMA